MEDSVFVSGLPVNVTESEIEVFFGSIGVIKIDKKLNKPKIWLFKDRESGEPKGEATITYDDPSAAQAAIQWFNGQPFNGGQTMLKVSMATRKNNFPGGFRGGRGGSRGGGGGGYGGDRGGGRDSNGGGFGGGRGGPRGGGGGGGGRGPPSGGNSDGPTRDGDWRCTESSCGNMNFSWRSECNRCKTPRSDLTGGNSSGGPPDYDRGGRGGFRGGRGGRSGGFRGGRGGGDRGGFGDRGGRGGDR